MLNWQADFVAEATESAIQRLEDIFRHPDDLTNKLAQVRKKIALEKSTIETQLKMTIEAQLDNSNRGLETLLHSQKEIACVKDTLLVTDDLCANAQDNIKNYNQIKKVLSIDSN